MTFKELVAKMDGYDMSYTDRLEAWLDANSYVTDIKIYGFICGLHASGFISDEEHTALYEELFGN